MSALKKPAIVVNFKTYPEASGSKALALARTCEVVARDSGVSIAVAPPMPDLASVAGAVDIPVLAQHLVLVRGELRLPLGVGLVHLCRHSADDGTRKS